MKLFRDTYKNLNNNDPITLSIGNFDGVHKGHQALIKEVKSYKDTKSAVLTFSPHPMKALRDVEFQEISTIDQKIKFLSETNIDMAFVVTFNKAFADLSVNEFITFLKNLSVKRLILGRDARFARHASGSIKDLIPHFEVIVIEDIKRKSMRISTTYIKDLIYSGDITEASKMLSRPYELVCRVMHGDKVGRTLNMPTANLNIGSYVLPKNGVYFVTVDYNGKTYGGALNIGYNPTINYKISKRVEVHILDFDKEIYDEVLTLKFMKFLRPEYKFSSKEALMDQLELDKEACRMLFTSYQNEGNKIL